ncbi:MAG: MFS transporter [Clostridiales bacterium]|nr:MFS transporter [Clostridiales bacterium]
MFKTYFAYGIGQACDTIPYCMFYTFFIYFLTDNVGLDPMVAGAISLIAVCWDGITDPVVGYLSDRSKNPKGRRLPWMKTSMVPLAIVVFLLFAPFDLGTGALAVAYYVVVAMAFWTLYTTYVIPYMSLGAELTADYNGRNYIRMFNMICGGLFMLLCTSGPTVVQTWGTAAGMSVRGAWGVSGAIFGAIALICGIVAYNMLKKAPLITPEAGEAEKHESIFAVLKETLSIKPYRRLCIMVFLMFIGYILASSASVYLIIYNCSMSGGQQAIYWFVYAIAYILMVPVGSAIANKLGKKQSFMFGTAFTIVCCLILFFVNQWNFTMSMVYVIVTQLGSTCLWTNYLAFAYDCAEIDEYKNGKRREGSLCAVVSFAQKFGSALGTYGIGVVLTLTGYDAMIMEQSTTALYGISGCCTIGIVVSGIIGMIIMAGYPVGKKEYDLIMKAKEDKKAGRDVDESGFSNCL